MGATKSCEWTPAVEAEDRTPNPVAIVSTLERGCGDVPVPSPPSSTDMEAFIGAGPACSSSARRRTSKGSQESLPPPRPAMPDGGRLPEGASTESLATEAEIYRIRFFNFNMANSSSFASVGELQGPGGRGSFLDVLREPLGNGDPCDIAFATLVETRLNMTDWVQEYLLKHRDLHLNSVLAQNARREGGHHTHSKFRKWMEGLAASYNGNLKSMLAFRGSGFEEDQTGALFGRLTEAKVVGIPVPNPKKAFMGRSIITQHPLVPGGNLRFCFVSAHFPIALLAKALEESDEEKAKVSLVHTLRRVLKKASRRRLADENTVFFVQGDLNSRTLLSDNEGSEPLDVLQEVLKDETMQAIIQHELGVPPGRWRELPSECRDLQVHDLPVTYKFHEQPKTRGMVDAPGALTLGDVIRQSQNGTPPCWTNVASGRSAPSCPRAQTPEVERFTSMASTGAEIYKRAMSTVGDAQLTDWGLVFKKHDFRAFRFPACADRVIYWAPDCLADRMSWELPRGGYEVNYSQFGSDHRPVALEAVLRIMPTPVRRSPQLSLQVQWAQNPQSDRTNSICSSLMEMDGIEVEDSDSDHDDRDGGDFAGSVSTPAASIFMGRGSGPTGTAGRRISA